LGTRLIDRARPGRPQNQASGRVRDDRHREGFGL